MKHDAWMNDLFCGTQLKLEPSSSLRHAQMSSVLRDLWSDYTCERCGVRQVYLSTPPVDCQGLHFPASEKASLNKKTTTIQSRMRIAKNSATGFPVTSKDKSSNPVWSST